MSPSPPATLVASAITVDRGPRRVLDAVDLTVGPGTCLGLVGPNGSGKTTLLRVLAGLAAPDAGTVRLDPPRAPVGYLAQEHRRSGETVLDHLRQEIGVADAEAELAAAGVALGAGEEGAEDRFAAALERFDALGAGDADARLATTLAEYGLEAAAGQRLDELSGGQRAKVALAALELARFAVTWLDEPTNDLDFDGLRRLETLVRARTAAGGGGLVVVSHDRAFLERCVTAVLELDEHDHRGRPFNGGWAAYLEERATARSHAEEDHAVYRQRRQQLADRAQRERQWATSGARRERRGPRDHDKAQRDFRLNRTEQLASRARRTERALARLEPVEKPFEGWELRYTIAAAGRAGAVVARLEAAVVERGAFRLGPVDLEIGWGERVAVVGSNGAGKTTLVDAVVGRAPLVSGTRWLGPSVVVGELDQARAGGSGGGSLLDQVLARTGLDLPSARSLLAKFGLGAEHVDRDAGSLSPGERTRAELAVFQAAGVNLLVLDEPTNHLDLPAIEQLEAALDTYPGTLILVTHDRRLLERVRLSRTVAVEGGRLTAR